MDFAYSPKTLELQARLMRFMDEHICPAETHYEAEGSLGLTARS